MEKSGREKSFSTFFLGEEFCYIFFKCGGKPIFYIVLYKYKISIVTKEHFSCSIRSIIKLLHIIFFFIFYICFLGCYIFISIFLMHVYYGLYFGWYNFKLTLIYLILKTIFFVQLHILMGRLLSNLITCIEL